MYGVNDRAQKLHALSHWQPASAAAAVVAL